MNFQSFMKGKELLNKDLRKVKLGLNKLIKSGKLLEIAEQLSFSDTDLLLAFNPHEEDAGARVR